jgi:hypothetical protein
MMLEDSLVIGRKEILRPPPRPFPLDHGIDGDVAYPELLHFWFPFWFLVLSSRQRPGSVTGLARPIKPKRATEINDYGNARACSHDVSRGK